MKKKVIAYVHFHWDREWYREFEIFRMRLLRAFDNVLEMLSEGNLPSFYMDGHAGVLLDYLEIRPEKESLVRELIKEKRLFIGPFYCLVDEFLTNEECFRKNIEIGLNISKSFGCEDFVAYFADTFGHSASTIPILREYGIDKAIVWRGCGDIPAEFTWEYNNSVINTVNLVRGYFNDVFSLPFDIKKKAEMLKFNLDKIADKSGDILLLPIGADHLGVERDLVLQINQVNEILEDYEIEIGTIFDYFEAVKTRFSDFNIKGELRDNTKTFILEGSYSSRIDVKKYNVTSSYKLDLANNIQKYFGNKYENIVNYAYKLLIQNQAHDSICGCSTDDVHSENITRYKKIQQISDNIIEELRFKNDFNNNKILNLGSDKYSGVLEFDSTEELPFQIIKKERGFDSKLLSDTQRIPITEDYTDIYTYAVSVKDVPLGISDVKFENIETDLFVTDKCIGNSKIFLSVDNGKILVGDKEIKIRDYIDNGDSYNAGPVFDDYGKDAKIINSTKILEGKTRCILGLTIDAGDILNVEVSLDNYSDYLNFNIQWENTKKNHQLQFVIDTNDSVLTTYSEDMGNIIERNFDAEYDIRKNLPKERGIEAKSNNAPMQRGVFANGVGLITEGITQYEVYKTELKIPLLRATGVISNPKNSSRSTPAGPPIETPELQQLGSNNVNFSMFLGKNTDLKHKINHKYSKCVIL